MITVQFSCCGCDAKTSAQALAHREPAFSGHGGFCVTRKPTIEAVTPEGWVAFDPYTLVTYCPECWRKIMDDDYQAEPDSGEAPKDGQVGSVGDCR